METADVQVLQKAGEPRILEPPTISDPWELMNKFYDSDIYNKKLHSFYEAKILAPDVTEREKEKRFLESDSAEYALLDFGLDTVDFKFDRARYPEEFLDALSEYQKVAKGVAKFSKGIRTNEETLAADSLRFDIHSEAAKALVKAGIAPSVNIGRAVTSIILVDAGLESREDARRTTRDKIKSKYGTI